MSPTPPADPAAPHAAQLAHARLVPEFEHKLCLPEALASRLRVLPRPLVMTNGVFDLLHRGHATVLAQARSLGASLLVAVNDDASVRRLQKGPGRPFNRCEHRMALLAALASTDLVTCFDGDNALAIIDAVLPEIYVKGGDYDVTATPEGRAVIARGGRAAAIPFVHYTSTTELAAKIRSSGS